MSFRADRESELDKAFASTNWRWRMCSVSREAAHTSPFGAWAEVEIHAEDQPEVPALRLRLVQDRGHRHVDVQCGTAGDDAKRWVPLEILAVAAERRLVSKYLEAFEATLAVHDKLAADGQAAELPTMFNDRDPLRFVSTNVEKLAEAAANAQCIRETEARVAAKTTAALQKFAT